MFKQFKTKHMFALILAFVICAGMPAGCGTTSGSDNDSSARNTSPPTDTQSSRSLTNANTPKQSRSNTGSISETALGRSLPDIRPEEIVLQGVSNHVVTNEYLEKGFEETTLRSCGNVSVGLNSRVYYVITNDGQLHMWGRNSNGELGDGAGIDRAEPILVAEDVRNLYGYSRNSNRVFYMLKNDNTVWTFGNGVYSPEMVLDDIANVIIMNTGNIAVAGYPLFQSTDGTLLNRDGEAVMDKVKYACTWLYNERTNLYYSPAVLFSDGSLYTFSNDFNGNVGPDINYAAATLKIENVSKISTNGNSLTSGVLWAILENGELWAIIKAGCSATAQKYHEWIS